MNIAIEQEVLNDTRYFYPTKLQGEFLEGVSVKGGDVTGMLLDKPKWQEVINEFAFIPPGVTGDNEKEFIRMGKRFEDAVPVMLGGLEYMQVALDTPTTLAELDRWITVDKSLRARGKDAKLEELAQEAPLDTELAMTIGLNSLLASSVKTYYKQTQPTLPAQHGSGGPAV